MADDPEFARQLMKELRALPGDICMDMIKEIDQYTIKARKVGLTNLRERISNPDEDRESQAIYAISINLQRSLAIYGPPNGVPATDPEEYKIMKKYFQDFDPSLRKKILIEKAVIQGNYDKELESYLPMLYFNLMHQLQKDFLLEAGPINK